jgi:hypothetical protein
LEWLRAGSRSFLVSSEVVLNLVSKVNSQGIFYRALALLVRAALLVALTGAGWIVYQRLPSSDSGGDTKSAGQTTVQIVLRRSSDIQATAVDIPIELSPVDIVAVRHEFFVEPRAGQRFDEFLHDRMNGRSEVKTRLDDQGRASILVPPGNWWLHAVLPGEMDLEWRLPITISGGRQTIELTLENAYTRSKSF